VYRLPNVIKIVTVTKVLESKLVQRYGMTNVKTIYNPLNFELIDVQSAAANPFTFNYCVAVGSFKYQNGFDLLIEAYCTSKLLGHTKLVIVGDGALRPKLESQIESLSLQNDVILAGKQMNPFQYMAHADFFVLSSRFEGFPNVLVEALACGKACIATDFETGPREIITDGLNGMLIEVNSAEAIRVALDQFATDPGLVARYAANARQSVAHLALASIADEWLSLAPEKA